MKACGIVAEYNPLHKGHAYQIEELRANTDVDVVIAVMSGNFLQRGEPAILDKWTRTKMALAGGVDLVIELPVIWSVQPADYFAEGSLDILHALNIDYLSFGTEDGQQNDFLKAASFIVENEKIIDRQLNRNKKMNLPYAKKMENVLFEMYPEFPLNLQLPNVQLGLSYQKEIIKKGWKDQIEIVPIKRKGAGYHEESIVSQTEIASATAIRKATFDGQVIQPYIADASYRYFREKMEEIVSWEDYFPYLKYQLIIKSEAELREIYQMTEGLENRLKNSIDESHSFEEFMRKIKTKRYTQTRLQRLLIYVLLNIKQTDVDLAFNNKSAIRVLGFNKKGRTYLNQEKNKISRPILSNVNQQTKLYLKNDIKAGDIYRLGNHLIEKQDFTRMPIKFD